MGKTAYSIFCWAFPAMVALAPGIAAAQCAPREVVLKTAEEQYGEVPAAMGVMADGSALIELLLNSADGSFTLIMSRPDGISCIGPSGHNWVPVTPKLGQPS